MKLKTADYAGQITDQINQNLDRTFTELQRLSLVPLYDAQVVAILQKYNLKINVNTRPTFEELDKMSLYIAGSAYNRPELHGIHIIAGNGYVFTNVDPSLIKPYLDVSREEWYQRAVKADGAWTLIPQHQPSYYVNPLTTVSVARLLRDQTTSQALGVIIIDMKLDFFRSILSKVKFEEEGSLLVVNGANELVFEESRGALAPGMNGVLQGTSWTGNGVHQMRINAETYMVIRNVSDYSGLKVVSFIPVGALLKETKDLRNFTLILAAGCLVVAGLLAFYFAYQLSRPLLKLKQKMLLVQNGNFHHRVPIETQDEFGQLGIGFNRMVEEIERLVNEVYVIGLREKEAELVALQSQINPHFIYNTLESINMMAVQKGVHEVSDMVSALGRMLRYTVDRADRFVRLEEEWQFVQSYVKIQQLRYGERLLAVFDMEEEASLQHCLVPKLLLQPLVENAIYHGLDSLERGGTIWVSAAQHDNDLLLMVRDDGTGMKDEHIQQLKTSIHLPLLKEGTNRGMALRNIYQRLALLYPGAFELDIDASDGEGTAVTIIIPLKERNDGA
ncbi:cache domain-containing sensor histidine kinase [Paenibacillus roseipurpureus]|uniref:Histidine kinase n=1 Tax=Paenibacillus roseopurpureus TaxID=2918901 RepID=A0AA96LUF1_9BACL|nr:histidine kinase [Paenibacillus sp. MBLB1832]WNR44845.1 histidine kinase [Paenibacillus sp. MBLB1832]